MNLLHAVFVGALTFTLAAAPSTFALASGSELRAQANPYNEAADARAEIQHALAQAADEKKLVLLVFGANWCGDCKILDTALKSGTASNMIAHEFKVVKINVGRFDKNMAIATQYGVPLKKGIPAIAVLSSTDAVLLATKTGELADARKMGEAGIYDYFKKIVASTKAQAKLLAPPVVTPPTTKDSYAQ